MTVHCTPRGGVQSSRTTAPPASPPEKAGGVKTALCTRGREGCGSGSSTGGAERAWRSEGRTSHRDPAHTNTIKIGSDNVEFSVLTCVAYHPYFFRHAQALPIPTHLTDYVHISEVETSEYLLCQLLRQHPDDSDRHMTRTSQ
jgi:hypothetical protein